MIRQIRRELNNRWWAALAGLTALGSTACGAAPESFDDESLMEQHDPLWQITGALPFSGGFVPICFEATVPAGLRTTIRQQIEATWENVAKIDFFGYGDCASPVPNGNVAVRVDASISPALGVTQRFSNPATSVTRVGFVTSSPSNKTIVHEFGHVLGFHEENSSTSPCTQRSSGAVSLEWEADMNSSVMTQSACNSSATLSAWDILGVRMLYGQKPPGSIAGMSGLSLNIQGGVTPIGTPIIGWPATGNWNDVWKRPTTSSLLLQAQTGATLRCLNIQGGVVGSGHTPLITWDCNESFTNEQFHFTGVAWRAMGNRCVQAESSASGAKLSIAACSTSSLQKWDFFEGDRRIRLNGTSLCASVPGGSTALGTELQLATCSTSATQTFTFTNGHINFSNRCFNVLGGTTANGNRIALWDGCGSVPPLHNEQFTIRGPVTGLGQCVELAGGVPFDGVGIGVAPCVSGAARQTWEYYW